VQIADVDCTTQEGNPVCQRHGVRGYPTLQYFLPNSTIGEGYTGGRSFDELKQFVEETLEATCDVDNLHNCNEAQAGMLRTFSTMTAAAREREVEALEEDLRAESERHKKVELEYYERRHQAEQELAELKSRLRSRMRLISASI